VTATQLKAVLPALRAVSDADVSAQVALADEHFDVARWGGLYAEGLANWVADRLVVNGMPLSADDGAEVSKSVGDTSFSLSGELVMAQARDTHMRTRWGQRYRQLADMVGMGGAWT
jgi:hypothetical protein